MGNDIQCERNPLIIICSLLVDVDRNNIDDSEGFPHKIGGHPSKSHIAFISCPIS